MDKKGRRFIDEAEEPNNINEPIDVDDSMIDGPVEEESIDVEPSRRERPREIERTREIERDERLKKKNSKQLERHMKKKRAREERSDREVLSYEDMPLEERETSRKSPGVKLRRKRVVLAVIIVAVVFALVFLFANSDRLSLHNISNFIRYGIFNSDSEERFPVDVQGENITAGNFARVGQDLCYASDTGLTTLNNYGKKLFSYQHGYTTPVLAVSNSYSLLYSLGGTGFHISSLDGDIYEGEAENNILVADIVDSGVYAMVTQSDGYLAKLYVYDKDNNQIFAYSFADYYITAMSLCSDGRHAVLAGLSAMGGSEISSIYVLDFTKDAPAQFVEIEDSVIYDIEYLNDSNAAAVGSNGAYAINTGNGRLESTSYEGRTLTAYSFNSDTATFSISLSRSGDGRNCEILSFRSNGSVSDSFSTELRVIGMSTYKGRVALLTTDTVYLYNKNGGKVSSKSAGIDPKAVVLYTSSDAYVVNTSEIASISL